MHAGGGTVEAVGKGEMGLRIDVDECSGRRLGVIRGRVACGDMLDMI